jgi:predicted transcriptional regulator
VARCTFLTNHALVLNFLSRHPLITAYEISSQIGITERTVRKIIADFDNEGYIVKEKTGRRVNYKINSRMPLQDRTQQGKVIGDLLKALG